MEFNYCIQHFEGQTLIGWVYSEIGEATVDLMVGDVCLQTCVANIYSKEAKEELGEPFRGFMFDFSKVGVMPDAFQLRIERDSIVGWVDVVAADIVKRPRSKGNKKLIEVENKRIAVVDLVEMICLSKLLDVVHLTRQKVETANIVEFVEKYIEDKKLWPLSINILFWGQWYSDTYLKGIPVAPLVHYLMTNGVNSNPNPIFDTPWFMREYELTPELYDFDNHRTPLLDYMENHDQYYATSVIFDGRYYLDQNQDVREAKANPLSHFFLHGEQEKRKSSPYLSPEKHGKTVGNPLILLWDNIQFGEEAYDEYENDYRMMKKKIDAIAPFIGKRAPDSETVADSFEKMQEAIKERFNNVKAAEYQIDIIIPFYNGFDYLQTCVDSILTSENESLYRILLVNDGSTEDSSVLEKYKQFKNVKILEKENEGYLLSCNFGAKQAKAEYLAIINSDVVAPDYFVDDMLAILKKHPQLGVLAPTVFYPNGVIQEQGGFFNENGEAKWITAYQKGENADEYKKVEYASGVAFFLKRSTWVKLNGYDPKYAPAYCEDTDLCIRAQKIGLEVGVAKNVLLWHALSQSYKQKSSFSAEDALNEEKLKKNKHYLSATNTIKLVETHESFFAERKAPRVIAFYLPQYHQIPENNKFWGRGFTEWRNVTKALPVYKGHAQPILPTATGFYDLNCEEVEEFQFSIARKYGIDAFCYYFYWLDNKHILNLPLRRRVSGKHKFPFCICWANENWTRAWDGQSKSILMEQKYDRESMTAMFQEMIKLLDVPEYITVNGKPLVLIYNHRAIPECKQNLAFMREYFIHNAKCEPYIALVESFSTFDSTFHPSNFEADALVSFAPHGLAQGLPKERFELLEPENFGGGFYDYEQTAINFLRRQTPNYTKMQCVMPGWDNTARRGQDAGIFPNSAPGKYRAWLEAALHLQKQTTLGDEQCVFVNAWNEWAEGAILEPSVQNGYAFLEATYDAKMKIKKFY
ncbi:glycoside hydrolase family 99-like domain-containing protein [Massilia sp. W12]|uniref:glycoside hydrolase family 99-like domain-containing protein n=1 Tax=Massilia sp. W12 TaxID=3126507 RepID=UPI0030D0E1A3